MEFSALKSNLSSRSCPLRERIHSYSLFPPPSMGLFYLLDHTSTKPRDTKFSYFLLQFALLLFTWLRFKMRNLLPLVMSVMHKSPFMTSLAAHFPSSLLSTLGQRKISEVATVPDMHTGATASQPFVSKYCQKQE